MKKDIAKHLAKMESQLIREAISDHFENKTNYCLDTDKDEQVKLAFEQCVDDFFGFYDKKLDRDTRSAIFKELYNKHKYYANDE